MALTEHWSTSQSLNIAQQTCFPASPHFQGVGGVGVQKAIKPIACFITTGILPNILLDKRPMGKNMYLIKEIKEDFYVNIRETKSQHVCKTLKDAKLYLKEDWRNKFLFKEVDSIWVIKFLECFM